MENRNNKILILCILFGLLGVHRFYTKHTISGIIQLLLTLSSIGLFFSAIWVLVDLILILVGKFKYTDSDTSLNNDFKQPSIFKIFITVLSYIFVLFVYFMILTFICMALFPTSNDYSSVSDDDKSILTIEKYGEEYPFTIDNLTLKCENQAVWVEDKALNKYALNGLADGKFQGRGDYKGYTTSILLPNKTDNEILNLGFTLCK